MAGWTCSANHRGFVEPGPWPATSAFEPTCFRAGCQPLKRSEEHTSELQSRLHLVCRLLLEKKKKNDAHHNVQLSSLHLPASPLSSFFFFFNDTATTEIYTLSLHDALPI